MLLDATRRARDTLIWKLEPSAAIPGARAVTSRLSV